MRIEVGMYSSRYKGCATYSSMAENIPASNPDPVNYKVLECVQIGSNVVAIINYPDCNNYNGKKVIVYLNTTTERIKSATRLDPHFDDDSNTLSPFARFEPTELGIRAAECIAINPVGKWKLNSLAGNFKIEFPKEN